MTVLAAGWENMGGRRLRQVATAITISYPLTGPLGADADHDSGQFTISDWTNSTAADYPANLGAETADAFAATLAGAFAATPA